VTLPSPSPTAVPERSARRSRAPWLVLAAAAVGAAVVGATNAVPAVPACGFRAVTGWDCPGCGLTRGLHELVHAHPLTALDHNVLLAVVVPLAVWAWLAWAGAPLPRPRRLTGGRATAVVLALLVAFAVVRNLPLPGARWLGSGA
jgi:Protein of unknown function (DUF2752)